MLDSSYLVFTFSNLVGFSSIQLEISELYIELFIPSLFSDMGEDGDSLVKARRMADREAWDAYWKVKEPFS